MLGVEPLQAPLRSHRVIASNSLTMPTGPVPTLGRPSCRPLLSQSENLSTQEAHKSIGSSCWVANWPCLASMIEWPPKITSPQRLQWIVVVLISAPTPAIGSPSPIRPWQLPRCELYRERARRAPGRQLGRCAMAGQRNVLPVSADTVLATSRGQ